MSRNIHEGRMLLGMLALAGLLVAAVTLYFAWWLPLVMVGFYAAAYIVGAVLIKAFDL